MEMTFEELLQRKLLKNEDAQEQPGEKLRLTLAALRGYDLGEPPSYGGQKPLTPKEVQQVRQTGMPLGGTGEPVEIIRGTTASYAGPRAGEEYLTPGQARQAFRRDLGEAYQPAGAELTKYQAAATLSALKKQAESETALHPAKYFEMLLTNRFGTKDTETGETVLPPYARSFYLANLPKLKTLEDAKNLFDEALPQLEAHRRDHSLIERLNDPKAGAQLRASVETAYLKLVGGEANADPRIRQYIRLEPANPNNLEWFKNLLPKLNESGMPKLSPSGNVPTAAKTDLQGRTSPAMAAAMPEGEEILRRYESQAGALSGPAALSEAGTGFRPGLQTLRNYLFGTPESWQRASDILKAAELERRRNEELRKSGEL